MIVLVADAEDASAVGNAIAAGAANVRFTEVELRHMSTRPATGRPGWTGADELRDYDGVVLAASARDDANTPLGQAIDAAAREQPDAFLNTIFAVAGTSDAALLARVATLGGIIVSIRRTEQGAATPSRVLGERVATVVAWVRHARSHDHGFADDHRHHHSHHHG
jgi:hypothetical protein